MSIGSLYSPPKSDFEEDIRGWLLSKNQSTKQIVMGDFNAHSPLWGYSRDDARGDHLVDQIMAYNYVILNPPSCPPTYRSGRKVGRPDLTLCTQALYPYIENWQVIDTLFGDHYPIETTISFSIPKLPKRRFKTKNIPFTNFNKQILQECEKINFKNVKTKEEFDELYQTFKNKILKIANKNFKKKAAFKPLKIAWWSTELRVQRNKVAALYKKAKLSNYEQGPLLAYKKERAIYQKLILKQKEKAWTELCKNETNPFGITKNLAFQKFQDTQISYLPDALPTASRSETLMKLTEDIFGKSKDNEENPAIEESHDQQPFTTREIKNAIYSFNINKAPGCDQIDHRLVRNIYQSIPSVIHDMYNVLLKLFSD